MPTARITSGTGVHEGDDFGEVAEHREHARRSAPETGRHDRGRAAATWQHSGQLAEGAAGAPAGPVYTAAAG